MQYELTKIAEQILAVFSKISSRAKEELAAKTSRTTNSLAYPNEKAATSVVDILSEERDSLKLLLKNPAVARVRVKEGQEEPCTYYICPSPPPSGLDVEGVDNYATYKSRIGDIASGDVGEEVEVKLPKKKKYFLILEKAILHPVSPENWDSKNTQFYDEDGSVFTITSLRNLLSVAKAEEKTSDLKDESENITEGITHSTLKEIGLRDQFILDRNQSKIFRLSIDTKLVILGPPGTGKTTTLIHRLGQKTNREYLEDNEKKLIDRAHFAESLAHEISWLTFTPTELLRIYMRDAYSREGIAAPNDRVQIWSEYAQDIARNQFSILRKGDDKAGFIRRKKINLFLQEETVKKQIAWFEDFDSFQTEMFMKEIRTSAQNLADNKKAEVSRIGSKLLNILPATNGEINVSLLREIGDCEQDIESQLSFERNLTKDKVQRALNRQVNVDKDFLDAFADLIQKLNEEQQALEGDADAESDEDEEEEVFGPEAAANAYRSAIRSIARARYTKRNPKKGSRTAHIAEWLGDRKPDEETLQIIGESLYIQTHARKFLNPLGIYMRGVRARYRQFRRDRKSKGEWYVSENFDNNYICDLEIDLMLLAILRSGYTLLENDTISRDIDENKYSSLKKIINLSHNQIIVDEVTDFSPIQIACMSALSNPQIQSFSACGDFNQRITPWGCRKPEQLEWALPRLRTESFEFTYRHSEKIKEFIGKLAEITDDEDNDKDENRAVKLPRDVNNEGVSPVLGKNLNEFGDISRWLTKRICEIEKQVDPIPTTVVLVPSEDEVAPLAKVLEEHLSKYNLKAVACVGGQILGQNRDVRVINAEHIKGLEFEAVFFVNIDKLAEENPDLFDKYLYVGATRAATFLGLTCSGENLPDKIKGLESDFKDNWR